MAVDAAGVAAQYEQEGYALLPELFSAALCRQWKAECGRILDGLRRERPGVGDPALFPGGVFVGLAQRSPVFAAAAAAPAVLQVLTAVLGADIEFLSDKVVFRNATEGEASPWHQDYPYWGGCHKASLWIALDRVTPENGCLRLLPGTHRGEVRHDQVASSHGFGVRVQGQDDARAVDAVLEPGGAVLFHDLTLHASYPNRNGADRWAIITTYRPARAPEPERLAWPAARLVAGARA